MKQLDQIADNQIAAGPLPASPLKGLRRPGDQVKIWAKEVLFVAYLYSGWVQLRDAVLGLFGRAPAVIVYYHRIGEPGAISRSEDQFRSDIAYLKRRYRCIGLNELCRRINERRGFNRREVVITFDDGYRDNFLKAAPILKEAGLSATFFVSTGFVDTDREFPHDFLRARSDGPSENLDRSPKLTWDDLRAMQADGFEIGSHTVNHVSLGAADDETISREVGDSIASLNRELGIRPRAFSFPWGKPSDISESALDAVRRAGYYAAVSAFGGVNGPASDIFRLRRVDIGNGSLSTLAIKARIAGLDFDYRRLKAGAFVRSVRRAMFMLIAIFCVFGVIGPVQASPKVLHVAPGGNDNNPGSLPKPLLTPSRALEVASPGDTIYLRAGRYWLSSALWISKPKLTIASYPGERATLLAGIADNTKDPTSVVVIVANDVLLVELEIQGGSYYGVKVDVEAAPFTTGVQIRGCRIRGSGRDCIKTFNADNLVIEDCEVGPSGLRDPSNAEGIDCLGSKGVVIRRCYVHDTSTNGIYFKGGTRNGVVERCRVENTRGFGGILLGQDTDLEYMRDATEYEAIDCVARNNIVVGTGAAGLGTYSGLNVRFENNTLYDVARTVQAGFWIVTNSRGVPARQVTFKNNILVMFSRRPMIFVQNMADQLNCDSNIYYNMGGPSEFRRETIIPRAQADTWSFENWKLSMRVDGRSRIVDPLLESTTSFRPRVPGPAIDSGESVPGLAEDFLGSRRPQGNAIDIGAHEQALPRLQPGRSTKTANLRDKTLRLH